VTHQQRLLGDPQIEHSWTETLTVSVAPVNSTAARARLQGEDRVLVTVTASVDDKETDPDRGEATTCHGAGSHQAETDNF
jgi:hypothetical protein